MTCQKYNNPDVQPGSQRYFYFGVKLTHSRNPCALKSQPCKFGPSTVMSARFDKFVLDGSGLLIMSGVPCQRRETKRQRMNWHTTALLFPRGFRQRLAAFALQARNVKGLQICCHPTCAPLPSRRAPPTSSQALSSKLTGCLLVCRRNKYTSCPPF